MLKELAPLLLDRDSTQVEVLTDDVCNFSPWKGGRIIGTAVAAINMALYDIAGKGLGCARAHHSRRQTALTASKSTPAAVS